MAIDVNPHPGERMLGQRSLREHSLLPAMRNNPSIHGLRGLAAGLVFVYHIQRSVIDGGFAMQPDRQAWWSIAVGHCWLAVDLFFMISGLLIFASLQRHASIRRFFVHRCVRIYPAFLVPHMLVFIVGPLIGYSFLADIRWWEWIVHFFSNLLMLPGVFDFPIAQIVAWSLSFEMAFYVMAASGFVLAKHRLGLISSLAWLCWIAAAATLLWFHPRFWYFIAGICVYWLSRPSEAEASTSSETKAAAWPLEPVLGIALLAGMFATHNLFLPLALLCGGLGFWVVVRQRDWLSRLLQTPLMQYLGTISYSWYLWHTFVLYVTKRLFGRDGGWLGHGYVNLIAFSLVSLVGSIVCAHLSYHWIEVRSARWLLGRKSRKESAEQDPTNMSAATPAPTRQADEASARMDTVQQAR